MRHGEAACDTESGDTAHIGQDPEPERVMSVYCIWVNKRKFLCHGQSVTFDDDTHDQKYSNGDFCCF